MDKLKLYLDTSAISHLDQDDAPEKMEATLDFWDFLKTSNLFDVFISDIVLLELERCNAPKTSFLLEKLNEIKPVIVRHGEAIESLAQDFLKWGILTPKSIDDIRHMACAVFIGCHLIASWNMKHFVNVKTTTKLIQACSVLGFTPVDIATPQKILEDYQNDDD